MNKRPFAVLIVTKPPAVEEDTHTLHTVNCTLGIVWEVNENAAIGKAFADRVQEMAAGTRVTSYNCVEVKPLEFVPDPRLPQTLGRTPTKLSINEAFYWVFEAANAQTGVFLTPEETHSIRLHVDGLRSDIEVLRISVSDKNKVINQLHEKNSNRQAEFHEKLQAAEDEAYLLKNNLVRMEDAAADFQRQLEEQSKATKIMSDEVVRLRRVVHDQNVRISFGKDILNKSGNAEELYKKLQEETGVTREQVVADMSIDEEYQKAMRELPHPITPDTPLHQKANFCWNMVHTARADLAAGQRDEVLEKAMRVLDWIVKYEGKPS